MVPTAVFDLDQCLVSTSRVSACRDDAALCRANGLITKSVTNMIANTDPHLPASIAALGIWWERQRGARAMPSRSELDPAALLSALPDLTIIDVAPSPSSGGHIFTYRLTGTRVDDRLGINLTGKTVENSVFGDEASLIQEQYETAVADRRPALCRHHMIIAGSRYVEYERLAVPLSDKDETRVVALVAAVHFNCAFLVQNGRPSFCHGVAACDQNDLCIPRALGCDAARESNRR
jgi:hypothetical protein